MDGKYGLAVLAFCATCLSACATGEHQACRFGDPFDGQPAVHEAAQSKKPPATAGHLATERQVQQQATEPSDEPLGEQIAQSTQPLDSPEPDDEKADEKLDWFKPIRLGH